MIDFLFDAAESNEQQSGDKPTWKVLIADDEPSIHQVTQFVIDGVEVLGRDIELISVYTGSDAKRLMAERNDIALAILDVVMEEPNAGLEVARYIREDLKNIYTRIVLRTGQPGEAPEDMVIREYDINDYKEKTELTSSKLKTLLYSTLRSYRDICEIADSRRGLESTITSIAEVTKSQTLKQLSQLMLKELANLFQHTIEQGLIHNPSLYIVNHIDARFRVLASAGDLQGYVETDDVENLPDGVAKAITKAFREKKSHYELNAFVGFFDSAEGGQSVIYLDTDLPFDDIDNHLLEIFAAHVAMVYENLLLKEDILNSERELLQIIGNAIEMRNAKPGYHVERVARISRLLAISAGLPDLLCQQIYVASRLHDIGKLTISDAILLKPSDLSADEWEVMQSHAQAGQQMLQRAKSTSLRLGAVISGQSHEKWNGTGYPNKLKGTQIDIAARIVAVAEVIDVLSSKRCYKDAWSFEQIKEYLIKQSGDQFDPHIAKLAIEQFDEIQELRDMFVDE